MGWKEPEEFDPVWVEARIYENQMATGIVVAIDDEFIYVQFYHGYSKWGIRGGDRQSFTRDEFFGYWSHLYGGFWLVSCTS